jgi:diadenylate cyclase
MYSLLNPFSSGQNASFESLLSSVSFNIGGIVDLTLVAIVLYWLYSALKDTRALGIIYGICVLVVVFAAAKVLRLDLFALIIANSLTLLFVAIPVLFQPELRRLLERLGRTGKTLSWSKEGHRQTVDEVAAAVRVLSAELTGALIVFKRATGLADISTSGVQIDAVVSTALLLNLFHDKAPLHDGAVIIDHDRIVAAGVMLPLSEREYSHTLGARHRAAVGLTEQCDSVVLVVSEERGVVSLVVNGKITPGIDLEVLPEVLHEFLTRKNPQTIVKKVAQKTKRSSRKLRSKNRDA